MSSGRGLGGGVAGAGVGPLLEEADRPDIPKGSAPPLLAVPAPVCEVEVPNALPPKSDPVIAKGSELAEKAACGLAEGRPVA